MKRNSFIIGTDFSMMTTPAELSNYSLDILADISFTLAKSSDNGMWKYYLWTNSEMQFALTYDRGFYDCDIIPFQKPIDSMNIIRLLRLLKNDKAFYQKELITANRSYTLTPDEYVKLFSENYDLLKVFLIDYNQEKYDSYDKFEYSYNGL